jgi:hypothetical protein
MGYGSTSFQRSEPHHVGDGEILAGVYVAETPGRGGTSRI